MARDYYDVLSIPRNATKDEVKRAFRRLARQYHPDVSQEENAAERFKEINEAYEILSDDEKRARYDRFGHAGVQGAASGFGSAGFTDFQDIFDAFFNNVRQSTRRGPRRGGDLRVDVTIEFEEAAFGVEKEIEFPRLEICDVCHGVGAEDGSSPTTCPDCRGTGEIRQPRSTYLGSIIQVITCPRCGGKGSSITKPCRNCDGSGRKRRKTALSVKIPAGVHDGLRIQVRGEGDAGESNAPNGDLFVVVAVKEHAFFKRRDSDIILDINVNVAQAALGDKIMVPTLDGDVELVVAPGTQTGKVFRLRGKGVPRLRSDGSNSGRGDQLVYVTVSVPTKLSDQQRQLFEQLAETFGQDVQPQNNGRGFFDRVMDFLSGEQS